MLVSYPYMPEQNGNAEMKQQHMVELGLSILYHAPVLLIYRVDAFFTTIFLINLLPSLVLEMSSSFGKLFGRKHDYRFLRVFECECYSHLKPYGATKFDPRSLPYIFLGYS